VSLQALAEALRGLDLNQAKEALAKMPAEAQEALIADALAMTSDFVWVPNPGPQTDCYYCEAEETLFGGEPGGGKSQVLIGLALTTHERSLLLRRTGKEASKFVSEIEEILGSRDNFNGKDDQWRLPNGKVIDHGGCQHEDDKQKYKGTPHDLIGFDELTDFSLSQYMFIKQWNRTTTRGQRCRVVASSNGPSTAAGLWVVERWAAWLDPKHPNPADSGEIRWYLVNDEGKEEEVEGPGPYKVLGRTVYAMSRTFIRSKLDDNPDLAETNYGSALMNQSGDNRKAYALGDFTGGLEDAPNQAIPTSWVTEAMERWGPVPPVGVPMCAIGVDVAQGGRDNTTLAPRHDGWFAKLISKPGKETKTGVEVAGFVTARRRDGAPIVVDVGGGWGADAFGHLRGNGLSEEECIAYMGVKKSSKRTANMQFTFGNVRTEAYWRFREALDPNQPGGSPIQLPADDRILVADLCAPVYENRSGVLWLESKEVVCDRLKRSTDRGDAVVMSWYAGARMSTHWATWPASKGGRSNPQVKTGRAPLTARRR
jgi:hypothetical protein